MADAEGVVLAFFALRERRDAVLLLDRVDAVAAAGEDLVRIALVADVPDQAVVRRVVQVVQRDGQLDHAQAGAEMAAALAHRFDQVGAQFLGDRGQFGFVELAQVGGDVDAGKAGIARGVDHRLKLACGPRIVQRHGGRGKEKRADSRVWRGIVWRFRDEKAPAVRAIAAFKVVCGPARAV